MKQNYQTILYSILGLFCYFICCSQENYKFEHFLVENGLPHNIINHIIQDKKGFIWFATTNGLSKYNGYSFQNYKTQLTDKVLMKNNRIDWITEDSRGRIWMKALAYNNKAYCFDPITESFWGTELIPNFSENNFDITQIKPHKSGLVWLLSNKDGCIVITNSAYSSKIYNTKNRNLNTNVVNNVFEDTQKNSWLLTDKGVACVPLNKINQKPQYLTRQNEKTTSFYSAIEFKDEIWFGGSNGTLIKYTKGTKNYRTQKLELDANIVKIEKLDNELVLVVTEQKGFCTINIFTGQITKYDSSNLPGLKTKGLNVLSLIKKNMLWFVNDNDSGINLFNFKTQKLKYFPASNTKASSSQFFVKPIVLTDAKGEIWVQPNGGGFSKYDEINNRLIPFNTTSLFPKGNFSNNFHTAMFDKQGNLWYNVQTSGIVKVVFNKNNFKLLKVNNPSFSSETKDVRSIFQDSRKNIWVANKQNQITILDKNLNKIGYLSPNGQLQNNATWNKPVYSIIQDSQSNIWIGTRGDGLYKFVPQTQPYTYSVTHYKNEVSNPYSISDNNIYSIFEDQFNKIWIGTLNGLNLISSQNQNLKFINHNNKWKKLLIKKHNKIRCINQDSNGLMYIGTTSGLVVFNPKKNLENSRIYEITNQNPNCLNSNDIIDFCITKNRGVFIATADGGISKVLTKDKNGFPETFKNYTPKEGLASNNILSIVEDNDNNIWITTDYILTRFNPNDEHFEIYSEVKPVMSYGNFTEATKIKLDSGELFFGYSEGLLHFSPDQIKSNNFKPYLAFTNFQLFNQNDNNHKLFPLSIDSNNTLELDHNQNFFNIEFAALDYISPENIKYAYKLDGFDENWNYVNNQRTAFYTNVPKGSYTFKVKSTNSQGNWVENERTLNITVNPSIWNTTLAYIFYALLIIGCIMLINYAVITIYRLKTNAQLEKDIFNMKQKFFIDISHELRTPLTLITGPIEYLLNDNRTPEVVKKQLSYVSQSTSRLQRLVNQILDFRKIQDQKLQISELNLTEFTSDIFNNFIDTSQERNINYNLEIIREDIKLWADKNALEKIIMNLLSNAFKYTPDEKSITVRVTKNNKQIILQVIDEGIGISEDYQNSIFNRFASFNKNNNNPSTGIGLSMVKELVEKHHGEINFISKTNVGSTFSIYFKLGNSHFGNDVEIVKNETTETNEYKPIKTPVDTLANEELNNNDEKIKVLVVEDDLKLRTFLKNVLEDEYKVIEAEDGEIGYQKILENTPDFIISDIMMPKLNGVDLLKKIRNNIETSHVPVILLTAKTTIESKLEGLSYGADDYITKPFSVSYLKVRITNLLEQRKRLQNIFDSYQKNNAVENDSKEYDPKPYLITDQDEEIMQKIMLSIEENMDNNDFSVEDLGAVAGLNRTTFFYKIKSLTGLSPVEFIRDVRIKRAAQLLISSQLLIKEIAYMTGFSDIKYFTKSFKNKYNLTPTEYRQKNKN
ncbi:hybrid sensor histidine kinase/response regulator [Flavobacterium sufflavum]|uniref:histidine kinase n=1 Tax=Flavobacterium sufflavum TaxID=1921138 RepID=A0A437KL47_9FLAO|nr:hybrid sensor histidine kinase/response regulator transcription factor [Flavobacterium sufflavum]RVT71765.1 hybrid sensor histidine kinase/response regulator [Flavobacterium sufflavum]